ncbi:RHS repeat-associated core domain-containing protein [Lysobacter enzymogenes]|uniref:RHS repeat-associated core domain-containing protein n=1 Tax=Lysobacter enzymogenes TaxID=69 RepID=UPI001AF37F0D|nr:RHS repeat-associated core domain-containing protein [Lysobacter enzymogenes]QQQ01322.1 PAAR/RHS domain-containing protein [Lysobacter enzymogenes]
MTVSASVALGAARSGTRTAAMEVVREPASQGYQIPNPDVSGADRLNNGALDFLESEGFNNIVMVAQTGFGMYTAGAASAATVTAAGGTLGAAATAAAVSAASVLGITAVGIGSFMLGNYLGDKAADAVFGDLLGMKKIATEGDMPARMGDPIAHVNKNLGLLGALVGAALVIAVGVATCGAGLVVMAAAVAVAGVAGGAIAGFASKAGQYGANKGAIMLGSLNVFFEGRPVARVGDPVMCSDHPGPMVLAEGARTVYANNRNIVRIGHRTTCDANVNDGCKTIVETMETAQVFEIKDSRSPYLRWANVITNLLPLPRKGRRGAPEHGPGRPPHAEPATKSGEGSGCSPSQCTKPGEPVDVGSGDFIQEWPVLDLPGTIPLRLERLYRSTAAFAGGFGDKWADTWSQRLELGEQTVTYHTEFGTTLVFHTPDDEVEAMNLRQARYLLFGRRSQALRLYDRQTRLVYSFEAADGRLRRLSDIEDRNGNRIGFLYQDGGLRAIEHSDGYRLDVRQEQGRLRSVRFAGGEFDGLELLRCDYADSGQVGDCASYQFGRLFHEYDRAGRMIHWRDTRATQAWIDYDEFGRAVATRTAGGHYDDRFEYLDAEACTVYRDAEGGVTRYYYNRDGLVERMVDPLGHEWLTEWDEWTHKQSETDPLGRTLRYHYNDFDEVIQVDLPDGRSQRYEYAGDGSLHAAQAEDGGRWEFQYDGRGNLIGAIDPLGRRTGYRIGANGEVLRQDNPDGTQLRYGYDRHLRLDEAVRADGTRLRLRHDAFGRVTEAIDALGHITRYEYAADHAHPRGSLSRAVLDDGSAQEIGYDSELLAVRYRDGEGRQTHRRYGPFDLLEEIAFPAGNAIRLEYDKLTRLTAVVNGVGERYRYEYDALGRLVGETDYSGIVTRYAYNAVGWLVETRRHDGSRVAYENDPRSGRLLAIRRHAADATDADSDDTEIGYDEQGRLTSVRNRDCLVEYERDAHGRVIAERIDGREVRLSYDADTGALAAMAAGPRSLQWQYDLNGALAALGTDGHAPLRIARDALGRDVRWHSEAGFELRQQFNALNLLTGQIAGRAESVPDPRAPASSAPSLPPQVQRGYRYDRAFNPIHIDDRRWGASRYRYDANGQVTGGRFDASRWAPALDEGFDYDGAFNLINRTLSNLPGVERQSLRQDGGRVVRRGRSEYRYDALGRLVEKTEHRDGFRPQHWRYRWDHDSRLVELTTPQGERWRYAYDGLGRRIRKFKSLPGGRIAGAVATHAAGGAPSGPSSSAAATANGAGQRGGDDRHAPQIVGEQYQWSFDQLIEAAPIYADGTVAYDRAVQWDYAPGAVVPMAQLRGGKRWYVVSDHIGTPRELLDETGEVVWSNQPEVWGRQRLWQRNAANDDAVDCPIRFPGQYFDAESGLHYNRHRYYDPDTGQYLSPDPLGLEGGHRPQAYVGNPNGWIDPLGLAACPVRVVNDTKIHGTGQVDRTPGHNQFSEVIANKLAMSGKFTDIYLNRAYNTHTGGGVSRRRPDIMAVDHNGKIHAIEIASRTDMRSNTFWNFLTSRNRTAMSNLPVGQRGDIISIRHPYKATRIKSDLDNWLNGL